MILNKRVAAKLMLFFSILVSAALQGRTWSTVDGKEFEGELSKYVNGMVVIQKQVGGRELLSINKLSAEDQAYVRGKFPSGDKKASTTSKKPPPQKTLPKQAPQVTEKTKPKVSEKVRKSTDVQRYRSYNLQKGDKAPFLSAQLQGVPNRIKLDALQGKLVLVHYWSYQDEFSLKHLNHVTGLYQKYHDKGLEIIGVHVKIAQGHVSHRSLNRYEEQYGITWPMTMDSKLRISKKWGFKYTPTYLLVDANGYIAEIGVPVYDLEATIQKYIR